MRYSLTTAFISRNNKLSPEVHTFLYIFASAVLATSKTKREFSLPFPHRSGGIFAAAAPAPGANL